jgi:cysteinyl-tRNA synthetase
MQSAFKLVDGLQTVGAGATCNVEDIVLGIQESLNDDLNTPQVIAHLFELARRINVVNDGKDSITEATKMSIQSIIHDYCGSVLGMKAEDGADNSGLEDAMSILLELRGKAKSEKNWALSDQIRDALKDKGFEIKDGKEGTTWNKI